MAEEKGFVTGGVTYRVKNVTLRAEAVSFLDRHAGAQRLRMETRSHWLLKIFARGGE
jgi:hypothetical protein